MKDREFVGIGNNMEEAAEQFNVGDFELEPTGECFRNETLQSFEARDFGGNLVYFAELNFEDMVYVRVRYNDYGQALFDPFKVVVRKWVVIDGSDREYGYKRTHADTAAEASALLHRHVAEFASDRFENYAY